MRGFQALADQVRKRLNDQEYIARLASHLHSCIAMSRGGQSLGRRRLENLRLL